MALRTHGGGKQWAQGCHDNRNESHVFYLNPTPRCLGCNGTPGLPLELLGLLFVLPSIQPTISRPVPFVPDLPFLRPLRDTTFFSARRFVLPRQLLASCGRVTNSQISFFLGSIRVPHLKQQNNTSHHTQPRLGVGSNSLGFNHKSAILARKGHELRIQPPAACVPACCARIGLAALQGPGCCSEDPVIASQAVWPSLTNQTPRLH